MMEFSRIPIIAQHNSSLVFITEKYRFAASKNVPQHFSTVQSFAGKPFSVWTWQIGFVY